MAHRPILGGGLAEGFESQFPNASVDSLSASATLIEQLANDGTDSVVSHASGCFWRHGQVVYLLTARHVLSGREPFGDTLISKAAYIPRKFKVYPMFRLEQGQFLRAATHVEIPEDSCWLQDPNFEELRTDVAALACVTDNDRTIYCLNDNPEVFDGIFTHVGMECAIVGYPTRHFADLMMPVWRRGSIASEPLLAVDKKPMFLLDAATGPGFSGSPVFRRHFGPLPQQQPGGSIDILVDRVMTTSFVGIVATFSVMLKAGNPRCLSGRPDKEQQSVAVAVAPRLVEERLDLGCAEIAHLTFRRRKVRPGLRPTIFPTLTRYMREDAHGQVWT